MHLRMIALVIVLMDTYVEGGGQFVNNKIFKKTISVLEKRLKEKLAISDGGCKKNWNQFKDHCYYFSKEKKSWFEAERFCRTENSSLVNINDVNENNWLMSNLKGKNVRHAWIGATDSFSDKWIWVSTFSPIEYSNWYSNEPNGLNIEHCAVLYSSFNGAWNNAGCEKEFVFVCKNISTNA